MITLELGDSLELCPCWPSPTVIVSDGPYGINGYGGDLGRGDDIGSWYEPHIQAWTNRASSATTLWFWNNELGWAEVHPIIKKYGWLYRSCNTWNKGISHVAGNSNTKTLRLFPVVTEVCVHYVRSPEFILGSSGGISAQDWLKSEWARTGLPFSRANDACGVKNAATRKYLTNDHCWYFPPQNVFDKMVNYANQRGDPVGLPYFAVDGKILTGSQWQMLRGKFYCESGVTNVWSVPPLRGRERIRTKGKIAHPNQKPLSLMERIVRCSSDIGDIVWEPFGGLCSASIAAQRLDRIPYAAEINPEVHALAAKRIQHETHRNCEYDIFNVDFDRRIASFSQ